MFRFLLSGLLCLALVAVERTAPADRRSEPFNADWRFARGPLPDASRTDVDDTSWQEIDLPHDWAIAGSIEPEADGATAKLPWRGEGWYRKQFYLPGEDAGQRVLLLFDGVMAAPKIYVNGTLTGEWDYGYNSFWVDITDQVKFGSENTLAVHADTRRHSSRWYPGAGIYRKVTMVVCSPTHVAPWGTRIISLPTKDGRGMVTVRSKMVNRESTPRRVTIHMSLTAPDGRTAVGEAYQEDRMVPAQSSTAVEHEFSIPEVELWDLEHPVCYTATVKVVDDNDTLDRVVEPFGVRQAEFTPQDSFHLNGRRVQLRGVNLHHDQGPLGAAFHPRAMERQLEILKEMGVNAIRTSHNPPAPEMLELCDRMGLLVFNELFDCWDASADLFDQSQFEPFMRRNVRNFVSRDRNHPCVIVWSIGNEIEDVQRSKPNGENERKVAFMVDLFKRYDSTRPVTMACHRPGVLETSILDTLDIQSWNYTAKYRAGKARYPVKPAICSESAAAVSTRDFYSLPLPAQRDEYVDAEARQISSYDLNSEWWSDIADVEFGRLERDRYCAGEFVWSGSDYLGEPLPFDDDWARQQGGGQTSLAGRSSYFGIVDLCGIPKDRYYLYRSHWAPNKLTVHILPHWNWPNRVGQQVPVFVYTNGDEAELFLNGKSLGRRSKHHRLRSTQDDYYAIVDRYRLHWDNVIFAPGELTAVAYKDGVRIGSATRRTASPPAALRLTPDRTRISAASRDLSYVLVEMVDAVGTVCPLANDNIRFAIDGPALIAGVGNGNPLSSESFVAAEHPLFFGKAMLIVSSKSDRAGKIVVTAQADGVKSATAVILAE